MLDNAEALEQLLVYKNFHLVHASEDDVEEFDEEPIMDSPTKSKKDKKDKKKDKKSKEGGASGFFENGSAWMGGGLAKGGEGIGKGFKKTGDFVASHTGSYGEVHVPKGIRKTFHFMNKGTGQILHFGSEAVGWTFGEAKKGMGYVGSKVIPKGAQEKMGNNFLVKGVTTTVDSVGNIIGGVSDGVTSIGTGARKGAHEVV